jgi:putative membrane protein
MRTVLVIVCLAWDWRVDAAAARRAAILRPMLKIVVRWLLLAAALLLVAQLYAGVVVASFGSALIAALVLGLLNALLRPLLVLLTLPVTVLTLGLFLFVINALMFYFAAAVLDGFNVTGFVAALVGSLLYSLCGLVIDAALERMFARTA